MAIQLLKLSLQVKHLILEISYRAQVGHIGSALSVADIIAVLYGKVLNVTPDNLDSPNRDRFILSKGHAAAALYSVLYLRGFISKKTLNTFCKNGSRLGVHPESGIAGIEIGTGSLGHGLSIGCGMALSAKKDKLTSRVYVLISDAECDEGQVWEAAMFAAQHKLDNLTVVIDYNKVQAFGTTSQVLELEPLAEKWKSFGWEVSEVDGHNLDKLSMAFAGKWKKNKPRTVIAHTIRGKGIFFMEHSMEWHYNTVTKKQYLSALKEINKI